MADASLGVASLVTRLDTSGLRTGLREAEQATASSVQSIVSRLEGIGQSMQKIGTRMSIGITAPLTALGAVGIRSAMQLETFSTTLNVLIGDTDRAKAAFEELYEFSANTTFEWRALTEGTRVLAAFGVEAEDLVPTLSMLGDVAAGLDTPIEGLAETFGRVLVTGRLSMMEVNSLAAKGVPIYTELAKQLGVGADEVRDLVSAGVVGFPQLEGVFKSLTSEGGQFFGMMEAQTDTVAGRLARLKDSFEQVTDVIGERLIPTFDKLVAAGQAATEWFINLDEGTQGLLVGLGTTLAVAGPVLVGFGTLLTLIPKVIAGFSALKVAVLPFIGPAGVFLLAVAGVVALHNALDFGKASRAAAEQSFGTLIDRLNDYRAALVVTSEAERQAALESLQRQQVALENIARVTTAQVEADEAFVRSYEERSFLGQVFSGDSLSADMAWRGAQQGREQLEALEEQLGAVESSLTRLSALEIPGPTTDIPTLTTQVVELGAAVGEALTEPERVDPAAAAKRWVERLAAELRFGLKGAGEVFDLLNPRVEELRDQAADALSEFGLDSEAYQDTVAKLEAVEGLLARVTSTAATPLDVRMPGGFAGIGDDPFRLGGANPRELSVSAREEVEARKQSAAELLAGVEAQVELQMALERTADAADEWGAAQRQAIADATALAREGRRSDLGPGVTVSGDASVALTPPEVQAIIPAARDVAGALEGITADLGSLSEGSVNILRGRIRALQDAADSADPAVRAGLVALVQMLEDELKELIRSTTPVALGITPTSSIRPISVGQEAFNAGYQGFRSRDRDRGDGGLADARRIIAEQEASANRFANTVVQAGFSFGDAAIRAFEDGDIVGVIRAGLSGIGSILGGANLGNVGFLGGSLGIGGLLAGGIGLISTLLGSLFGGGGDEERRRSEASARQRSVPAVNINFTFHQSNQITSQSTEAGTAAMLRNIVSGAMEDVFARTRLFERLERLEAVT